MTAPQLHGQESSSSSAPPADVYEALVITRPGRKPPVRLILLGLVLLLVTGELLHVRHVRANDRLRDAIMQGDVEEARAMLQQGADPNQRYVRPGDEANGLWHYLPGVPKQGGDVDSRKTLLMLAAGGGREEIVVELLHHGAKPNVKLANGQTALLIGANTPDARVVSHLLAGGAEWRVRDREGNTPLHLAARTGNVEAVTMLLDKGANVEEKEAQGQTALCLAAATRHEDVVERLLAYGASLNALQTVRVLHSASGNPVALPDSTLAGRFPTPPLVWAAQQGSPALICALWDKHLQPAEKAQYGAAALNAAIRSGVTKAVQVLLARGVPANPTTAMRPHIEPWRDETPSLLVAAGMHNLPVCRLLLERGANVNRRGVEGMTPLLLAANATQPELAQLLTAHGADVNARNLHNETPLMAACNSPASTAVLLAHGADVDACDEHGLTALLHSQNSEVMKLLLEAGADAHESGPSALLLARVSKPEVVPLLIARGANVNARDAQGKTALMRTLYDAVIPALLTNGADVNARDHAGRTALHDAVSQMSLQRVQRLLQQGANVNVTATNGETPLSLAKQSRYQAMIDLLTRAGATK